MERASNIELCRIFSIICVLLVHSAFAYNGWPTNLNETSLGLMLLESFSIIGVNVFVFISGWFSVKLKLKTILNIVFFCFYYFIVLSLLTICLSGGGIAYDSLFFVSKSNWFILDYLGLVLLSPILNKFIENSGKREFSIILCLLFSYYFWFGFLPGENVSDFGEGYSIISFCFIYLLARYLRLYGFNKIFIKFSSYIYVFLSLLIFVGCYLILFLEYKTYILIPRWYGLSNPLVILSAISFFFIFQKQDIRVSKFINHISKSCLGILLFHASYGSKVLVEPYLVKYYNELCLEENILLVIINWLWGIFVIFVVAIVIDQIRLYLFTTMYSLIDNKIRSIKSRFFI